MQTAYSRDHAALKRRLASGARIETREGPDVAALQRTIDQLGSAFSEFRSANDARVAEIARRGVADVLSEEKVTRINAALDELEAIKQRLEAAETRAARPGATPLPGEQRRATPAEIEHREAFLAHMRNPKDRDLEARAQQAWKARLQEMSPEQRAVAGTTDAAGGSAVPEVIDREVTRLGRDIAGLAGIVRQVSAGSRDYKRLFDVGGNASGWVGETTARTETTTPNLAEVAPTFGTVYAYPKATEESLQDIFFDVEGWLVEAAVEGFDYEEEVAIIGGNGTNKPTGFLAGPTPVTTTDKAGRAFGTLQYFASGGASAMPTSPDIFIDMVQGTRAKYRRNANWVANSLTKSALRKYKDSTGQYHWQAGLEKGAPSTFLEYPIIEAESMPDVAANAFPLAFGDFREGYVLCRIAGLRITRDEVTEPGYVKWYMRRRVGGKIGNSQAIKLLKISAS